MADKLTFRGPCLLFFVFLTTVLSKTLSSCSVIKAGDEDSQRHKTTEPYNCMQCNIYTLRHQTGRAVIDGMEAGIFRILSPNNFLVNEMVICQRRSKIFFVILGILAGFIQSLRCVYYLLTKCRVSVCIGPRRYTESQLLLRAEAIFSFYRLHKEDPYEHVSVTSRQTSRILEERVSYVVIITRTTMFVASVEKNRITSMIHKGNIFYTRYH